MSELRSKGLPWVFVFVAALAGGWPWSSVAAQELLTNPGWEAGSASEPWDETIAPQGWERSTGDGGWANWAQVGELEWAYKPGEYSPPARTGQRYITVGRWDGGYGLFQQAVPAEAGRRYALSVFARHGWGAAACVVRVEFVDADGLVLAAEELSLAPPSTTTWTAYTLTTAGAPPAAAFVRAVILGAAYRSHNHFDDVSLTALPLGGEADVVYHVGRRRQQVGGLGAQIWATSGSMVRVLQELNITHVRTSVRSAAQAAQGLGVAVVYLNWSAPSQWLVGDNELPLAHVGDYAAWWGGHVATATAAGMRPEYIELSNEPDGHWNTYIAPATYNALVKAVRAELDSRGLGDVGIVGPGLAHLNWNGGNAQWIMALDGTAVAALAGFSTHTWDDGDLCSGGPPCITAQWPTFGGPANVRNADLPKFITEYATKEDTFNGVAYPHPDIYHDYNATNSMPFAVRVYANTLALFNQGATVPFIWQAVDQAWEDKGWGLIDLAGLGKPVYYALKTLYPHLPVGGWVLDPVVADDAVYSAGFLSGRRLVVGLVNEQTTAVQRTVRITGVAGLSIRDAIAFELDQSGDPATSTPDVGRTVQRALTVGEDGAIAVALPAGSTLTLVLDVEFLPGDHDGDGAVTLADFAQLLGCLGGPGVAPAPGQQSDSGACLAAFDLDADGDVDLADFAQVARLLAD